MTVTAKDYAGMINYSPAMVARKMKALKGGKLPGVLKYAKVGNTWLLTLSPKFDAAKAEKEFENISIKDLVNSN